MKLRLNFLVPPPVPAVLPKGLELEVSSIKCRTREDTLRAAYAVLTKKYRGYRLRTVTRLLELFDVDVAALWAKNRFLHCTNLNYLLEIMLLHSGKFSEADIRFRWTTVNFLSPHQYMQIKLDDGQWVDADLWGAVYGIEFGSHAHGFHSGSLTAKR